MTGDELEAYHHDGGDDSGLDPDRNEGPNQDEDKDRNNCGGDSFDDSLVHVLPRSAPCTGPKDEEGNGKEHWDLW